MPARLTMRIARSKKRAEQENSRAREGTAQTRGCEELHMDAEQYARVRQAYEQTIGHPQEEWPAVLSELCGEDPALRAELEVLLRVRSGLGDFLAEPAIGPPNFLARIVQDQTADTPPNYDGALFKGRYKLERMLGKGGFGAVYLARDLDVHSRAVVVKIIEQGSNVDEWMSKRFELETKSLAAIDHHGVVGILDAGRTSDGKPFLVMQYVDGVTLRSLIAHRPLTRDRAVRLIGQVAEALEAAHSNGVMHRDLKPENIIVRDIGTPHERPVIIDFGIASIRQPDAREPDLTRIVGSRSYMAPEQLQGRPQPASDIWALGIVAYELLTGRKLAEDRVTGSEASLPESVREAIRKATAECPEERFERASEFATALESAFTFSTPRKSFGRVAAVVAIAAAVSIGLWKFRPAIETTPDSNTSPSIQLRFLHPSATATGPGDPIPAGSGMTLPGDSKLRLSLYSRRSYFLYILSESFGSEGVQSTYRLLFPDPSRESASLTAGKELLVPEKPDDWLTFKGSSGQEVIWIVASENRIPEFEGTRRLAALRRELLDGSLREAAHWFFQNSTQSPAQPDGSEYRIPVTRGAVVHRMLVGQGDPRALLNHAFRQQRQTSGGAAASSSSVATSAERIMIGVNVWRGRPARESDAPGIRSLVHRPGRSIYLTPELIGPDTLVSPGDHLRVGIEAAQEGFLYVVNQERCGDGTAQRPELIFPTMHLRHGNNRVRPGLVVEIPGWRDEPPYFELQSHCPGSAERVAILFSRQPFEGLTAMDEPQTIEAARLDQWIAKYGTRIERSAGETGRVITIAETSAGTTALTPSDPVPQIVFQAAGGAQAPVLVYFDLKVR